MAKRISVLLFYVLGCINISLSQSPWTQSKNGGFAQLSLNAIPTYSQVFDAYAELGYLESPREISDLAIQVYAEYGLTDNTTLLFNTSYKNVQTKAINPNATSGELSEGALSGLGSINLGIKRQLLYGKPLKLAAYVIATSKVGGQDEEAGLKRGYDAWLVNGGLTTGGSWKNVYGFVSGGVQFASANISHSFMSNLEVGTSVLKRVTVALVIATRLSFQNIDTDESSRDLLTGLFTNNQETIAPGLKVFGTAKSGWGISGSVFGEIYSDNYAKSPSINIGIFKKW